MMCAATYWIHQTVILTAWTCIIFTLLPSFLLALIGSGFVCV